MQVKDLDNKPQGLKLQELSIRDYFVPLNNKDNKVYVLLEKVNNNTKPYDLVVGFFDEDGMYTSLFSKDTLIEKVYIKKIEFTREDTRNA